MSALEQPADRRAFQPIVPLLVVRDAARALEFYEQAFGAEEIVRYTMPTGAISHADLRIGQATFSVTEEAPKWNSDAPTTLGGSPVVLQLTVQAVDALIDRVCAAGGMVVFPVQEFCGERMGRVRDPFGHLWILAERIEDLSEREVRARRNAFFAGMATGAGQAR